MLICIVSHILRQVNKIERNHATKCRHMNFINALNDKYDLMEMDGPVSLTVPFISFSNIVSSSFHSHKKVYINSDDQFLSGAYFLLAS
jgi:hypothetical protein